MKHKKVLFKLLVAFSIMIMFGSVTNISTDAAQRNAVHTKKNKKHVNRKKHNKKKITSKKHSNKRKSSAKKHNSKKRVNRKATSKKQVNKKSVSKNNVIKKQPNAKQEDGKVNNNNLDVQKQPVDNNVNNTFSSVSDFGIPYYDNSFIQTTNNKGDNDTKASKPQPQPQPQPQEPAVKVNYMLNGKVISSSSYNTKNIKNENGVYDYDSLSSALFDGSNNSWIENNLPNGNFILNSARHISPETDSLGCFAENSNNFKALHSVKTNGTINLEVSQYATAKPVLENDNKNSLLNNYKDNGSINELNHFLKVDANRNNGDTFKYDCEDYDDVKDNSIMLLYGNYNDSSYFNSTENKKAYRSDQDAINAYNNSDNISSDFYNLNKNSDSLVSKQSGSVHYLYFVDKQKTIEHATDNPTELNVYYCEVPVCDN